MNASLFDTLTRFIGSRTSRRDGTAEHRRASGRRGSVLWSKTVDPVVPDTTQNGTDCGHNAQRLLRWQQRLRLVRCPNVTP